jgi:hypothetical protein
VSLLLPQSFTAVLRVALDNLIVQFRGMTAGVTAGYAEVAQTIARLTAALDANGHAMEHFEDAISFADSGEEESKATDGSMHSASTASHNHDIATPLVSAFSRALNRPTSAPDRTPDRPIAPRRQRGTVSAVETDDENDEEEEKATDANEPTADGILLTPSQRSNIKVRASISMETGAKYKNPAEAAAAMVSSIESNNFPAIATRGCQRSALISVILEKALELRARLPENPSMPKFTASIGGINVARFRRFLEFLESGSRGGRAMADVQSSINNNLVSQQARVVLTYLINEQPRQTPARPREHSGDDEGDGEGDEHKSE